jgi:hypothetical protein
MKYIVFKENSPIYKTSNKAEALGFVQGYKKATNIELQMVKSINN